MFPAGVAPASRRFWKLAIGSAKSVAKTNVDVAKLQHLPDGQTHIRQRAGPHGGRQPLAASALIITDSGGLIGAGRADSQS